ncbi:MAG: efflux RND transporter permease subunit [Pseudomonadales bacterium]|nr:efflux RND transporter permease subunit [Pseudomonadales bacterium]
MNKQFVDFVVNKPKLAILLVLLVVFGAGSGAANLWQTIDYKVYYSKTDPLRIALDEIESTFAKLNNALVIIAPAQGEVFNKEFLALVDNFTEDAWNTPYSTRVSSITNYLHTFSSEDDLVVDTLLEDPEEKSDEAIAQARQIILKEENLVGRLVSEKGHVTAIDIGLQLPDNPVLEVKETTGYVRELVAKYQQQFPDVEFHLTGTAFADQVFAEAAERDMAFLIPVSYTIIIVLLIVLLRSFGAMLITLLTISLSIVFAFGLKGFYNGALSPIALLTPFMVMTIAVADCVHLFVSIFHNLRLDMPRKEAVSEAVRVNLQPVFLTSATTAIGFLCLNFSESPALSDLGNVVALGVVAAFFLSVILLPAMVVIFPFKTPKKATFGQSLMEPLANFVVTHKPLVMSAVIVFILVLMTGLPRNQLNEVFIDFFDDTFDFRTANDFYDAHLSGFHKAEYLIDSGKENGISDIAYLNGLDQFASWLRTQSEVAHVNIHSDTIKRINKSMNGDDETFYSIPDTKALASQYLLMYEMFLPLGFDLGDRVSQDRSKTRVTVNLWLTDSETVLAFNERAMEWLRQNTPESMHGMGTGVDIMFSKTARNNISVMYYGTLAAFVVISFILLVALRSIPTGIISLIPNILPALMAFGFWGYLSGRVGLGESVVASLTLGLIVDDTVHFLSKYLRARREQGLSAQDAVVYAFRTVGTALVVTTLVFAAGFGVLSFSHYSFNANMGALTAITICFALVVDFLLLPILLIFFDIGKASENTRSNF